MKSAHLTFVIQKKDPSRGREINAVSDMVMAEKYGNGVFIGNYDLYRNQGSSFSNLLMCRCRFVMHILIDIERITESPLVYNPSHDPVEFSRLKNISN